MYGLLTPWEAIRKYAKAWDRIIIAERTFGNCLKVRSVMSRETTGDFDGIIKVVSISGCHAL